MLMDASRDIERAVTTGMFEGRVVGRRRDGHGVARGLAGPHKVVIPAKLLGDVSSGEAVFYRVKVVRTAGGLKVAIATSCKRVKLPTRERGARRE